MNYIITQQAYDEIAKMHRKFWKHYTAQPIGHCMDCANCYEGYCNENECTVADLATCFDWKERKDGE